MSADLLSRADNREVEEWAFRNNTTRINPLEEWLGFCKIHVFTVQDVHLDRSNIPLVLTLYPSFLAVGWQPAGFCFLQASNELRMPCERIDPRHSIVARRVKGMGYREYSSGTVTFFGGSAKDGEGARQFTHVFRQIGAYPGLLLTPYLVDLAALDIQ